MPKISSHGDTKLDAEFDNIYSILDRLLLQVSVTTPTNPVTGTPWFNPADGKLKIFKNTSSGWSSIN